MFFNQEQEFGDYEGTSNKIQDLNKEPMGKESNLKIKVDWKT
jgi:hypothetical protein